MLTEEVRWWDLPPYRVLEDRTDDTEARIGAGEGETVSQGEAACPVHIPLFTKIMSMNKQKKPTMAKFNTKARGFVVLKLCIYLPDWGVWPPNHGEAYRASGEAPINMGDGEG